MGVSFLKWIGRSRLYLVDAQLDPGAARGAATLVRSLHFLRDTAVQIRLPMRRVINGAWACGNFTAESKPLQKSEQCATECEVESFECVRQGAVMDYNQFCPIAKAAEILGERWTILILREILMGGRRFNTLQRGLGDISPALLTKRLKQLEEQNMVIRRRIPGQKGYEYFPTDACESLLPVLFALGEWGIIWAKKTILDQDFDVEFLMLYLERSIDREKIKGLETIIKFRFSDLKEQRDWWLVVSPEKSEVCIKDPGKDIDVYFNCSVRTLSEIWMGDRTYRDAIKTGDLIMDGDPGLTRNVTAWLRPGVFAESPRDARPV
jgi:DNA-binding HxlR family transcriptional regulator